MNDTSDNSKNSNVARRRLFTITSRRIILCAGVLIVAGYVLMAGPGSTERAFNPDIFSARRIVVAPLLCLAGYLLVIVGILRKGGTAGKAGPWPHGKQNGRETIA